MRWLIPLILCVLSSCVDGEESDRTAFRNLGPEVTYVGREACRSCHEDKFQSFIHTGMGQSMSRASKNTSHATILPHTEVFDSLSNLTYRPFWKDDELWIREYRVVDGDTLHDISNRIDHIIGSGQHTNSHLLNQGGYVTQAPLTFYTQQGHWDLPPGFEQGNNSRWSRIISNECMGCHNGISPMVEGAQNKFESVADGIGCERCHGPGSLHIQEKLAGKLVDTSNAIDFSIVNPRHLPTELQRNVCERCHLQGVAVLEEGKEFTDFRPGMPLSEVMNVFLPDFKGINQDFMMASHAERLRKSACSKATTLTCISCHDPHVSVKQTPQKKFNQACIDCHGGHADVCAEDLIKLGAGNVSNCVQCHMPKSGTFDIPHVAVTDHWIQRPQSRVSAKVDRSEFERLRCMTNDNPSALQMARGFLRLFDGFASDPAFLDSAEAFLKASGEDHIDSWIHLHHLRGDVELIRAMKLKANFTHDAATAYRVAQAWNTVDPVRARGFYARAIQLMPLHAEFLNGAAANAYKIGQAQEALRLYRLVLSEQPNYVPALSNLGYILTLAGDWDKAEPILRKACGLDPDYELAWLNLARNLMEQGRQEDARQVIQKFCRLQGDCTDAARLVLQQLK